MYGFEAITSHNGWAMALAGALIVFCGLVVLSLAISQLHKILVFFEKDIDPQPDIITPEDEAPEYEPLVSLPETFPTDINEISSLYQPLIDDLRCLQCFP